jgi:hypothetical protein
VEQPVFPCWPPQHPGKRVFFCLLSPRYVFPRPISAPSDPVFLGFTSPASCPAAEIAVMGINPRFSGLITLLVRLAAREKNNLGKRLTYRGWWTAGSGGYPARAMGSS